MTDALPRILIVEDEALVAMELGLLIEEMGHEVAGFATDSRMALEHANDDEVDLALVIGRTASHVAEEHSLDYVAGYSVFCDYSERAYQKEMGGQWMKGKSCDTFGPAGPWLVPASAVPDPQGLRLWCKVNGELRQNGWTGDMMFGVRQLVAYMSRFMTLLPGDVIATGTPAGVGMGMKPPRYLAPGDCVELGIEGLGEMRQRIVASPGEILS